jgi:hypothetical protein
MRTPWKPALAVSLFAVAAIALIPDTRAGVDIAFGAKVPLGDDGSLFFNISSRYFERDPSVIQTWGRRFESPDDLAVFFWITERSHKSADFVFALRRQGLGWFEIGNRCGVPVDAWYVKVPVEDPGPPYGKAYGHWKKHQNNPEHRVKLNDRQARDLVAVRMCHEYYRVPAQTAMDWRRSGEDVRLIMTREYRERHGKHAEGQQKSERHGGAGHGRGASKH